MSTFGDLAPSSIPREPPPLPLPPLLPPPPLPPLNERLQISLPGFQVHDPKFDFCEIPVKVDHSPLSNPVSLNNYIVGFGPAIFGIIDKITFKLI
jgi:hypothetical protein